MLEELLQTQNTIRELNEQTIAVSDVMNRTSIVAPISGVVVNLQVFTQGGVVTPGQPLLDIVPIDDGLIIEARVDPIDVDVVRPGLKAQVMILTGEKTPIEYLLQPIALSFQRAFRES